MPVIDLTEWDNGKPHWLSLQGRFPEVALRAREKYRKIARAQRAMATAVKKAERLEQRLKDTPK
jgi:hypothetical protein